MNLVLLIAIGASSKVVAAFVPSYTNHHHQRTLVHTLKAAEGTDFDAPVLYSPESGSGPLDYEPVVDDECYMGKDGKLNKCADFGKCANPFHFSLFTYCPTLYIYLTCTSFIGCSWMKTQTDPPKVPVNLRSLLKKMEIDL